MFGLGIGSVGMIWCSQGVDYGDALALQLSIPSDNYNFVFGIRNDGGPAPSINIDWGDGTDDSYTTTGDKTHNYALAGNYTLLVTGSSDGVYPHASHAQYVTKLLNFGASSIWRSRTYYSFARCNFTDLEKVPSDAFSTVTYAVRMFAYSSFPVTSDLSGLDFSLVEYFNLMFFELSGCDSLDISGWTLKGAGVRMTDFLSYAEVVSVDCTGLVTAGVNNLYDFAWYCPNLTELIGHESWDVSNVTNFSYCFSDCPLLDTLDLRNWNIESATAMDGMMATYSGFPTAAKMSTEAYDATLIAWAAQSVNSGISVDFGDSQYTPGGTAEAARTMLISTYGWTITDGGAAT